jgi:hypothetical protein
MPRWVRSNKRSFGIYASGALFSFAWWVFFDALMLSSIRSKAPISIPGGNPAGDPSDIPWIAPPVKMTFADWVPGLLATLGMIVVNLIDKSVLAEAGGFGGFSSGASWGGDSIQWRARLFLFVGFALLAGGLAGSVTVLTIKYIITSYPDTYDWYGFANVVSFFNSVRLNTTKLLMGALPFLFADPKCFYHALNGTPLGSSKRRE